MGAEQNQRRVGDTPVHEKLGVRQRVVRGPRQAPAVTSLARPPHPKFGDGSGRQIVTRGARTCISREVRPSFRKDRSQLGGIHGRELFARSLQVSALVVPCCSRKPRRHVHNQNALVVDLQLFDRNAMREAIVEPGFGATRFVECHRPDDSTRARVGDAEDDLATTFVRQRDAVVDELLEVIVATGLLELQPAAFRRVEPLTKLFARGQRHACYSSPRKARCWREAKSASSSARESRCTAVSFAMQFNRRTSCD